jgi:hypothetical protein
MTHYRKKAVIKKGLFLVLIGLESVILTQLELKTSLFYKILITSKRARRLTADNQPDDKTENDT